MVTLVLLYRGLRLDYRHCDSGSLALLSARDSSGCCWNSIRLLPKVAAEDIDSEVLLARSSSVVLWGNREQ